jgi:hypothetical protein
MATPSDTADIWNLLLGGGAVAFVTGLYKVWKDVREGTWRRQDTAIADLEKWRRDADDAREWEALQHQWWRNRAGRLEYIILTLLGPDKLPKSEPYPVRPQQDSPDQRK